MNIFETLGGWFFGAVLLVPVVILLTWIACRLLGIRYIPHDRVGIVEKLWSGRGSLAEGHLIALSGEAGFQAKLLRGGLHAWLFPWQYRLHLQPLVVVSEGKLGYVYARDGAPLPPTQTLGRIVPCNHFQDATLFLAGGGQRGRQRAILREGVYVINLAEFVVITEERLYVGPLRDTEERKYAEWQQQLSSVNGYNPVVIGHGGLSATAQGEAATTDTIGVVTVHDGQPIDPSDLIAPAVPEGDEGGSHAYFQDPEAFLAAGGRRGKQLQVLTDGTFFINRWFATVEAHPKTLVPIGYVGVVVSYFGGRGRDVTGEGFRYGEQVESGQRGVWKRALPPGKYPLNPYALRVEYVPTVNFVLRWVTGSVEAHQYDKDLTSLDLITADGYEPVLPLSLVLHIDYEKAPRVIQRFGDVKRLISQTLDPILSAYFRDVAQSSHMLDLLTHREEIQNRATAELGRRFSDYDINCVAVLIGRPESRHHDGNDPIDRLFDQLRLRRLADEQKETFGKQEEAALQLKALKDAQAAADKQAELTQTKIEVEIAANRGEAQLAESERLARRDVVRATGEAEARTLLGRGEAAKVSQVGEAEAAVLQQKVEAYGDPRLLAVGTLAKELASGTQPIVPERLFVMGGGADGNGSGAAGGSVLTHLVALLLAERVGVAPHDSQS